jgi:hypothetical protein
MRWSADVASGRWIGDRLEGWGTVGGVAGRDFEAYARVFHPAEARRVTSTDPLDVEFRMAPWREIASAQGNRWHPEAQWGALSGNASGDIELGDGWLVAEPSRGRLPLTQLAAICEVLLMHGPPEVMLGLWEGWGDLHPGSGSRFLALNSEPLTPRQLRSQEERLHSEHAASVDPEVARALSAGTLLELPGRNYVLLAAHLGEFLDTDWVSTAGIGWHFGWGPTPNLIWPADRSWLLASEIDFDSTLVGGSRAIVDAVLADERLEVAEVTADTDLTITGDRINPSPPGR